VIFELRVLFWLAVRIAGGVVEHIGARLREIRESPPCYGSGLEPPGPDDVFTAPLEDDKWGAPSVGGPLTAEEFDRLRDRMNSGEPVDLNREEIN